MEMEKAVHILYTNWQGKKGIRHIIPHKLVFVTSVHHPKVQWCIEAYDLDK